MGHVSGLFTSFLLEQLPSVTLRVILTNYDVYLNNATRRELAWIYSHHQVCMRTRFYTFKENKWNELDGSVCKTLLEDSHFIEQVYIKRCELEKPFHGLYEMLTSKYTKPPFLLHGRLKSCTSFAQRMKEGRVDNRDVIGFRFTSLYTADLRVLAKTIQSDGELYVYELCETEQGKVIYLFGKYLHHDFELQFWPTLFYQCLESEHALVYKPCKSYRSNLDANTCSMRAKQHELQNYIDGIKLTHTDDKMNIVPYYI
jgi:hypothetical protein